MRLFKYSEFLLLESKINMQYSVYHDFMDWSQKVKDETIKNISSRIVKIHGSDVESKRLNKPEYVVSYSSDSDKISLNGVDMKIGRFLSVILPDLKDWEKEKFVNFYKSERDDEKSNERFELVSGDEIADWYDESSYCGIEGGTLWSSCMRRSSTYIFDIYIENPDVCELLILTNGDHKLVGRALVWKTTDGDRVMDRIYTIKDSDVNRFISYAKDKGWNYRKSTNYLDRSIYNSNEEMISVDYPFAVQLDRNIKYSHFPYLDTFRFYNVTDSILSIRNIWENTDKLVFLLNDDSGGFTGHQNMKILYKDMIDRYLINNTWDDILKILGRPLFDHALGKNVYKFIDRYKKYMEDRYENNFDDLVSWRDILHYFDITNKDIYPHIFKSLDELKGFLKTVYYIEDYKKILGYIYTYDDKYNYDLTEYDKNDNLDKWFKSPLSYKDEIINMIFQLNNNKIENVLKILKDSRSLGFSRGTIVDLLDYLYDKDKSKIFGDSGSIDNFIHFMINNVVVKVERSLSSGEDGSLLLTGLGDDELLSLTRDLFSSDLLSQYLEKVSDWFGRFYNNFLRSEMYVLPT